MENIVFNLYAMINGDRLWSEKPLVLRIFDNNKPNNNNNNNKNFDSAWEPVFGSINPALAIPDSSFLMEPAKTLVSYVPVFEGKR